MFLRRDEIAAQLADVSPMVGTRQNPAFLRLRREYDDATSALVTENEGLVRNYVKRFTSNATSDAASEFYDAGVLGLMNAIATYQVGKGTFAQWAYKRIQCEVLKAVRSKDHPTISAGDFERRPAILRALRNLTDTGEDEEETYSPSYAEIAAAADATVEQVRRVLEAPRLDSLAAPVGGNAEGATLGDTIADDTVDVDEVVLSQIDTETLEQYGLSCLDARELFVVTRRYGLDAEPAQHLSAIGEMLGLSREAIRQIESKALAKLQHPIVLSSLVRDGRAMLQARTVA